MNPEMTRRLAFIRYLYGTAVKQSLMPEPLSPVAVLSFHDAVELFLQLASEYLNSGAKQPNFMEYWELLSPKLSEELSQKESMRRLNKARVALKHAGTFPSKLDIEAFRATVTAFFEENTPLVFGVSLSSVSLADFVRPTEAKDKLLAAEESLKVGNFDSATSDARLAFELMLRDYEDRKRDRFGRSPFMFGESLSFHSSFFMGIGRGGADREERKLGEFVDKVKASIETMSQTIKVLAVGLDYRRYSRFRMLTPFVHWTSNGPVVERWSGPSVTAEEAQFCIDFVVESAVVIHEFDYEVAGSSG